MCSDEVRMFAFTELLERCPYPSMKTASIGLFKNQINGAFNSKKDRPPSVFASPVIVDKFFPILFRTSKKWCTEEDTFWDDYSYQMQALNLYLFLLICDKSENRTTVFDQEKQVWMNNEYIHHLEVTIDTIMERHKKDSNDSDEQQSGIRLMNLEMMKNVIEQIKQRMTLSV
ncbi:hypothetical protein PHYBLDRAFT_158518 [Phycomyces blakesleeanus NRRL 1555(-)]|uniref:Uncharacterized protein n=1 Tax=Phycomyces blakesleeanus (strain ATCC 8743b / DSM 1359 / FGSC 10004 / NBRC 33097 / NRRL 1555) TaxID=763407 RepID=A0A162UAF8_PHYB8|nr:hypothetical protein PHYBLDRAFT_158518 [Phycomyces blakesleeanus NRRL 1555(-)]OAD74772.1 hypothetical protein PHYBLDRAFT_158518 [Phycomyces blakesleeanus NRRL 1555(-)]|eukprot:XP_018292812.1 hypothetical protein PHYBLDRAFT_158518 [Phycomyces blakesleeanus NRRL 1555(-)]